MKKIICVFFTFIVALSTVLFFNSEKNIYGDGLEYLAMSVSFKNHFSPVRTISDKNEVKTILAQNIKFTINDNALNGGYFKLPERRGGGCSYHFWAYSLLVSPFLVLFANLGKNPIAAFTFVNLLLIILLFGWILFRNSAMDEKNRLFIALLTLFSPIWFYFPWTHTEVYTFVLLFIGLIEYYNNRKLSAVIFSSISSLQNPAASLVPFFILVFELVNLIKNKSKDNLINFIKLSCCSTIVLIPYIFYYVNYGTPSLIGKYATDISSISFAKIMSLFFDLNFGLIVYVPILIGIIIYLICKKDKIAILSAVTVFLFAIIDSAQLNWNSGMMLINRYSFWMIPVLMFGCFGYFVKISDKKRLIVLLLTILTMTPWLCYTGNKRAKYHTMFQPIAKSVLYVIPSLYNPQEEVYFKRCQYDDIPMKDKSGEQLPAVFITKDGYITKGMFYNKLKHKYEYFNTPKSFKSNLALIQIKFRHKKNVIIITPVGIEKRKLK